MLAMRSDDVGIWRNIPSLEHAPNMEQITKLWIVNEFVTEIPLAIIRFTELKCLNITMNGLTRLSSDIGMLANLERLLLSHNKIMHLPPELGHLEHLQFIDLRENPLVDIPTRYQDDKQAIVAHCRSRGFSRWFVQYFFIAVRCPHAVVESVHTVLARLFDARAFAI
jgi:Leucine-rich repeat (LRR) protein